MGDNPGMAAIGIGGIGFGVLLIYSAYTKKPLFGPNGLFHIVIAGGSIDGVGKALGEAAGQAAAAGAKALPSKGLPPSDSPPGVWV